jgi:catechol 2,3-dioxygenase-like lactoylglutathione lyase family enzyme
MASFGSGRTAMPLQQLEHFTICCRDLERTRDFYSEVLGLRVGARPGLPFAGYWLYCGDVPVVHLVTEDGAVGLKASGPGTGALDHIAFRGVDVDAMLARLHEENLEVRENRIPDFGVHQLFVHDPDGILIELNFRG